MQKEVSGLYRTTIMQSKIYTFCYPAPQGSWLLRRGNITFTYTAQNITRTEAHSYFGNIDITFQTILLVENIFQAKVIHALA